MVLRSKLELRYFMKKVKLVVGIKYEYSSTKILLEISKYRLVRMII